MRLTRRGLLATVYAGGLAAACSPKAPVAVTEASHDLPDATELASMIRGGEITAAEVVEAAIKRAEAIQKQLNFMVVDTFAMARERAKTVLTGPFAGVPYLIKDLNDVTGVVTRYGSRSSAGAKPATEQDGYVNAVFAAGVVCIGKSATPENGYLPTTEPLAFGPTRNPWNTAHSSGGSSGGSAAAVAAGVVPMAHANDGGGSIRIPATNCGLVGLKPSRGRMMGDENAQPLSLGVEGCVSRTVRDTAAFFAATELTGPGAPHPPVDFVMEPGTKRLRVGVLTKTFNGTDPDPEVAAATLAAAKTLEGLGHTVSETAWPTAPTFPDDFLAYWSLGAAADMKAAAEMLGKPVDETVVEPFSLTMANNAAKLKPEDIEGVQKRLAEAGEAYKAWIAGFDIVLSPVLGSPAVPLGYVSGDVPFETLRDRLIRYVGYTLIHNVAGAPAISLPLGQSQAGLPIGVQVSAAAGGERVLLELAYEVEAAAPWIKRQPAVWAG